MTACECGHPRDSHYDGLDCGHGGPVACLCGIFSPPAAPAPRAGEGAERLPRRAVATIDSLAHLVRLMYATDTRDYAEFVAEIAADEDALAALNACLGVGNGGPVPWDCDHVVSLTIREADEIPPASSGDGGAPTKGRACSRPYCEREDDHRHGRGGRLIPNDPPPAAPAPVYEEGPQPRIAAPIDWWDPQPAADAGFEPQVDRLAEWLMEFVTDGTDHDTGTFGGVDGYDARRVVEVLAQRLWAADRVWPAAPSPVPETSKEGERT